jgi:glycerophosphoryl diester phosphodiesterase
LKVEEVQSQTKAFCRLLSHFWQARSSTPGKFSQAGAHVTVTSAMLYPVSQRFEVTSMSIRLCSTLLAALLVLSGILPAAAQDAALPREPQIGPRPFYLVDKMKDGPLKQQLAQCTGPFRKTDFSIGHRGAALMFPEHSKESYTAAARMGAGVIECDVTFTKDRELVCRHSQCDLHTTTNILAVPDLAAKCSQGFSPADPASGKKASAKCCTSDITLAEFRRLTARWTASIPTPRRRRNI